MLIFNWFLSVIIFIKNTNILEGEEERINLRKVAACG